MLPISLSIFGTFGFWHIASIPLALVFNIYYPAVLALHLTPWGNLFDPYLMELFNAGDLHRVSVPMWSGILSIALAFAAMRYKAAFWALGLLGSATLIGTIYQIA
jgi:hypothetical protein